MKFDRVLIWINVFVDEVEPLTYLLSPEWSGIITLQFWRPNVRINFTVWNFIIALSEHKTIGSVVFIYSIVMAPKKAVFASRRSIRALVGKPKASSDCQIVDMLTSSAEIVVGSAEKSTNEGSLVRTESTKLRVVRRSRTTKKRDEHTVAYEKVSEIGRSTVVTSEV